jgi:hypothetical protein
LKLLIAVLLSLLCGNANAEYFEESHPPDPLTAYSYKDDSWSGWNKFWFSAAIGGQLADIATTSHGLKNGCSEGNPLLGGDIGSVVAVKVVALACAWYVTEYVVEDKETYRNWFYGLLAVAGFGAAGWNASQY